MGLRRLRVGLSKYNWIPKKVDSKCAHCYNCYKNIIYEATHTAIATRHEYIVHVHFSSNPAQKCIVIQCSKILISEEMRNVKILHSIF